LACKQFYLRLFNTVSHGVHPSDGPRLRFGTGTPNSVMCIWFQGSSQPPEIKAAKSNGMSSRCFFVFSPCNEYHCGGGSFVGMKRRGAKLVSLVYAALNMKNWVNFTLLENHRVAHNTRIFRF